VVRRRSKILLGLWFVAMLAIGVDLLVRHAVALPRPAADARLAASLAPLRSPEHGGWMAVHVLYQRCRCSVKIAEHLLATERPADLDEHVLLVGEGGALGARLAASGFAVHALGEEELASKYGVESVPLLVLVAPDGSVRYAGGYTSRKQGLEARDLAIIADAKAGRDTAAIPIFGCAVSERLRAALDPLRIR
jgi:hypothetical protein